MDGLTKITTLREASRPIDAHRIQQLRSMILAILDEPMVDKSSNVRFFRLPDRRILASLLESRPLQ